MAYTTIKKPTDYFNTKLYTGNGSAGNAITGVGFQSDFTWIKDRDNTRNHVLTDAVRGVTKVINSNTSDAEGTDTSTLTAFGTDGFTLGNGTKVNGNSINFASWNWKANGAGTTNTEGSLDSTVSVNTTAGFSIVKWTNGTSSVQTVGHGLGVAPKMIIMKVLGNTGSWNTYHHSLGNTHALYLNSTAVAEDNDAQWNDTSPTSTVFTTGTNGNLVNNTLVAYCFAEKVGYSKFSSYIGNGNTDGAFVYTGFKPAWIMRKNTDGGVTEDWVMEDDKRNTFNPANEWLAANSTGAEGANNFDTDFLSNGFKMRSNNDGTNRSGTNYIYMAFASEPIVGDNPATAR